MALGRHKIEYVGKVVLQAGAVKRMAPLTPRAFQKFRRRSG